MFDYVVLAYTPLDELKEKQSLSLLCRGKKYRWHSANLSLTELDPALTTFVLVTLIAIGNSLL